MKKTILIQFMLLITYFLNSQSIADSWNGKLMVDKQTLTIVIHITDSVASSVIMDIPDQYTYGIKSSSSNLINDSLFIYIKALGVTIKGCYDLQKDSIFADFKQMGYQGKIVFGRGDIIKEKVIRKQDPVDFPYYQEDVKIQSVEGVSLAGTLTMPDASTNVKSSNTIVVFITGSGAQDRNEEIMDHRPFLVLSDYLTRNGISVLRYDDRGTAESTGDFAGSTSYDFSLDTEAVVTYIKNREDLKDMTLGLIGHSEGGMIAPIVACRNKMVDFIVLLAGPGIPISQLMLHQITDLMTIARTKKEIMDIETKSLEKCYTILNNKKLTDQKQYEKVLAIKEETFKKYPAGLVDFDAIKDLSEASTRQLFSPWYKYFICFHPHDYLKRVKVPVLALHGTNDVQLRVKENLDGIEKSLKKAGNKNYKVVSLPRLNHIFQKCIFGSGDYYAKNEETFNEEAMKIIAGWINGLEMK